MRYILIAFVSCVVFACNAEEKKDASVLIPNTRVRVTIPEGGKVVPEGVEFDGEYKLTTLSINDWANRNFYSHAESYLKRHYQNFGWEQIELDSFKIQDQDAYYYQGTVEDVHLQEFYFGNEGSMVSMNCITPIDSVELRSKIKKIMYSSQWDNSKQLDFEGMADYSIDKEGLDVEIINYATRTFFYDNQEDELNPKLMVHRSAFDTLNVGQFVRVGMWYYRGFDISMALNIEDGDTLVNGRKAHYFYGTMRGAPMDHQIRMLYIEGEESKYIVTGLFYKEEDEEALLKAVYSMKFD